MTLTIERAIELIPAWRGKTVSSEPVSGGITNRTFKVVVDQTPYIVSIAGNTSQLLGVDGFNKFHNNKICGKMGLSPRVIHFLASEGVFISEFLYLPPLSVISLHHSDVQQRLIRILRKLHAGADFWREFDMFRLIRHYLKMAEEKRVELPVGHEDCLAQTDAIGKALASHRAELVPCHNDVTPGNVLDDGQRMFLVDFDYSGQNDPCFELGNLCVEAEYNDIQVRELLRAYYGRDSEEIVSRVHLHGLLSDIGWSLWAFIQARISNADFDFRCYGLNRWERVVKKLESGEPDRWLQYV